MAALAQPDLLETAIHDAVASVATPEGVRFARIVFDEDHAGSEAYWVFFTVSKKVPLTKARGLELSRFMQAVLSKLWAIPSKTIPYLRLEDGR